MTLILSLWLMDCSQNLLGLSVLSSPNSQSPKPVGCLLIGKKNQPVIFVTKVLIYAALSHPHQHTLAKNSAVNTYTPYVLLGLEVNDVHLV